MMVSFCSLPQDLQVQQTLVLARFSSSRKAQRRVTTPMLCQTTASSMPYQQVLPSALE